MTVMGLKHIQKIDGVFDQKTIDLLHEKGISFWSVDMRPKSFNFLQGHRFYQLLKSVQDKFVRVCIHFCEEKDFVIKKILDDVNQQGLDKVDLCLEFSDIQNQDFYQQFHLPFYLHFSMDHRFTTLLNSSLLKGVVFDYKVIEQIHRDGHLEKFLSNLHRDLFGPFPHLEIILALDWDSDLIPSLFERMPIHCVSYPLNQKIQIGYRQIDQVFLSKQLDIIKKQILNAEILP